MDNRQGRKTGWTIIVCGCVFIILSKLWIGLLMAALGILLICIAGRWYGGTAREFPQLETIQVNDLVSVRNYAAAGGDFEPLYCLEVLERGSGGKTTEVFRTADGLELQFTYVGSVETDGDGPAIYTLLPGAELSVLALPEGGSQYVLYSAGGSIREVLTEGAVIPLTEQDGGVGAESAYVVMFAW